VTEDVSRLGVAGGVCGREVRDEPVGEGGWGFHGRCAGGWGEKPWRGSLEEAFYREEFPRVLPKGDEDGHFRLSDLGVGQPQRKERLAVSGACTILQSDEVWIFGCDLPHFTAGTMWGEGFIFFKQKKCSNKLCLPLQFYLLYLSTVWYTLGSGR
jgi:hypothetical protein